MCVGDRPPRGREANAWPPPIHKPDSHGNPFDFLVTVRVTNRDGAEGIATTLIQVVPPLATIQGVRLMTSRGAVTAIVIQFSETLDPATVNNMANYRLASAGRDKKFGTKDDKATKLKLAQYHSLARTVTDLMPVSRSRTRPGVSRTTDVPSSVQPLVGRVERRHHDVQERRPPHRPVPHFRRDQHGATGPHRQRTAQAVEVGG
jgi:hypothetical protein